MGSHAPASAHTGSTERSHTAAGASLTEAAHTLGNTMIRITRKWQEKPGIFFILKNPENISSNFSVNIIKCFYPKKLRNVVLFLSSYPMNICNVILFLHSVKTNIDGPNSLLGYAQVTQEEFSEDYWRSPAECYDSWGTLWSYQAL